MSSQSVSQKEYLKKYLSRGGDDKKKKKKRKPLKTGANRLLIVDDDVDVKNMRPIDDDELELYNLEEDAPQIAGIIDERPEEVKIKEKFGTKKWKVVAAENDMGLQIIDKCNIKSEQGVHDVGNDLPPVQKEKKVSDSTDNDNVSSTRKPTDYSTCSFAEMLNDSQNKLTRGNERETSPQRSKKSSGQKYRKSSDSDASPPRQNKKVESHLSTIRKHKDDSASPPRRNKANDSDASPPRRRNRYNSDESPPRQRKRHDLDSKWRKGSDSDASPPRRRKGHDSDASPPRKNTRRDDPDSSLPRRSQRNDALPPKKFRKTDDSDTSPPRKHRRQDDSDSSPPRRNHRRHNLYESPPRKGRSHHMVDKMFIKKEKEWDDVTDHSKRERSKEISLRKGDRKYDSDESPARRSERDSNKSNRRRGESPVRWKERESSPRRRYTGSDDRRNRGRYESPPRKISQRNNDESHRGHDKKYETQGHKEKNYEATGVSSTTQTKEHENGYESKRNRDSDKSKTTMDGRKAGLVEAGQLRAEIEEIHNKEKEIFEKMDVNISGKGAAPVMRDRKTGKKRDFEQEAKEQKEKEEKKAERESKYTRWGKGLKQVEDHEQRLQNDLYEMSKPLARYADDKDLDQMLRTQEREGDPMLEYMRTKAKDQGSGKVKPKYEGSFMPNRFSVQPGYRWDGVDRSNGYEKQWFEAQNARKATEEEAYKWSTADM